MRNLEIIKEILKIVDRELEDHPLPLPEMVEIRELIVSERPQLNERVNDNNQLKLEGVE